MFLGFVCRRADLFQAAAAIRNWQSEIGKHALREVQEKFCELKLETVQARRKWVAEQGANISFIYQEPKTRIRRYQPQ
jgi:hypothetical protein